MSGYASGFAAGASAVNGGIANAMKYLSIKEKREERENEAKIAAIKAKKDFEISVITENKNAVDNVNKLSVDMAKAKEKDEWNTYNALKGQIVGTMQNNVNTIKGMSDAAGVAVNHADFSGVNVAETELYEFEGSKYEVPKGASKAFDNWNKKSMLKVTDTGTLAIMKRDEHGKGTDIIHKEFDRFGRKEDKQKSLIAWKDGKDYSFSSEAEYNKAINEQGYTSKAPRDSESYSTKDINKKKLDIKKLEKQKKMHISRGESDKAEIVQIELDSAVDSLNAMIGKDVDVAISKGKQENIGAKSVLEKQLSLDTTNNSIVNSSINKLAASDYQGFKKDFIGQDYDKQVKMIASGNQHAASAWIESNRDAIFESHEEAETDKSGFKIRPSQVMNQKRLEIQAMDINKEIRKNLLTKLEEEYLEIELAQAKDKDNAWYTGTLVESIAKSLPFGDTEAQFSDYEERQLSLQQLVEDKADYGKKFLGGIKLDKDLTVFGRADRFEKQTKPALKKIYQMTTGRDLNDLAFKRLLEEGFERSKFEFDVPFGGQEGRIKEGSELEKLLTLIYKTKK